MTEDEIRMAHALNACTFVPGIATKRFARQMASMAEHSPEIELTKKQHDYLVSAVYRFRRQIPADIVRLSWLRTLDDVGPGPERFE